MNFNFSAECKISLISDHLLNQLSENSVFCPCRETLLFCGTCLLFSVCIDYVEMCFSTSYLASSKVSIFQGEELTFDYNYVRVFGAAAKKCHCGSPQCRGYIGGDPQNTEIIYQGDSDDEYPEPVMLEEHETEGAINKVSKRHIAEAVVKDRNKVDYSTTAIRKLELTKVENFRNQTASAISSLKSSSEMEDSKGKYPSLQTLEISLQAEDITSIPVCAVQQEVSKQEEIMKETSALIPPAETSPTAMVSGKSFLDGSDSNRKSKSDTVEDNQGISKSRPRIKTSRKAGSIKKGKGDSSPLNGNKVKMMTGKTQIFSIKPKKITEGSSNGRFEAG